MTTALTLANLKSSAREYASVLSKTEISDLFGVTDGKAVGTYVELGFHVFLKERYAHLPGNAASGIDFPELDVDLNQAASILLSIPISQAKGLWAWLSFTRSHLSQD